MYRQRSSIRQIPLTFLRRSQLQIWKKIAERRDRVEPKLSGKSRLLIEALTDLGPLFFEEIQEEIDLLPTHIEESLVELFALGKVTCDHYGGIRALLRPERERRKSSRANRLYDHGVRSSGRWSLLIHPKRSISGDLSQDEAMRSVAETLLNRYGIVFRDLLSREGKFMPSWFELRKTLCRLEDRGEIRGGRFVEGVAGDQFALPRAVELLRSIRDRAPDKQLMTIHRSDPFNLSIDSSEVSSSVRATNYVVYRNGEVVDVAELPRVND